MWYFRRKSLMQKTKNTVGPMSVGMLNIAVKQSNNSTQYDFLGQDIMNNEHHKTLVKILK